MVKDTTTHYKYSIYALFIYLDMENKHVTLRDGWYNLHLVDIQRMNVSSILDKTITP